MLDPNLNSFAQSIAERFVLDEEIGRGSRGTVYRARDVANASRVAIKVLRADLASAMDSAQFIKQMRSAARVRHPGITPLLDVGEAANRLFCVSPFLEGESLRTRLRRERRLPLGEALLVVRQAADALGRAHAGGLVHKDVKPENIFLTGSRAMVMDLGLSRAITRSMDETRTGTGLTLGTPAYMSPEHALGGVEIDGRADLYSLGCVRYEMLAGEPPFAGAEARAAWLRTVSDAPVPIGTVRDALPSAVGVTLDRLLAKAPSARFPDATHLVGALDAIST